MGFHTFPRWERGAGRDAGGFGTRAGQPDSRESAAFASPTFLGESSRSSGVIICGLAKVKPLACVDFMPGLVRQFRVFF